MAGARLREPAPGPGRAAGAAPRRASLPAAMPVTDAPPADLPATACAWCGSALPESADRSGGRVRCARCGAATTDPWPSEQTLKRAYEGWYRPTAGRFAGPRDALLRRTSCAVARPRDRVPP